MYEIKEQKSSFETVIFGRASIQRNYGEQEIANQLTYRGLEKMDWPDQNLSLFYDFFRNMVGVRFLCLELTTN